MKEKKGWRHFSYRILDKNGAYCALNAGKDVKDHAGFKQILVPPGYLKLFTKLLESDRLRAAVVKHVLPPGVLETKHGTSPGWKTLRIMTDPTLMK